MSARTILYVHSSSGRYGADRQLSLIAGGLDPDRYRPVVVVPDYGPLIVDLHNAGVEVLVRPLAVVRRELVNAAGARAVARAAAADGRALRRVIREQDVALVHSNTSVVLGGAMAARLGRVPHVWHVREIYAQFGNLWRLHRRLLSSARALPCVSRATAGQFRQDLDSAGGLVRVIPDGLIGHPFRAPREAARAELGLPPDVPVIAVIGRISDWKGQDVLVRALASPRLRERAAVGLIAGDIWPGAEDRRNRVLQLARAFGVDRRLRLVGFRDDMENVYGAADIVAVPSTSPDPLPGSAVEAAAAGVPVIAADHGGLPEIIRDGVSGRLVPPGDAEALVAAAVALLDDPALAAQLGAAAAADVRERYHPLRLLHTLHSLYDEILN